MAAVTSLLAEGIGGGVGVALVYLIYVSARRGSIEEMSDAWLIFFFVSGFLATALTSTGVYSSMVI